MVSVSEVQFRTGLDSTGKETPSGASFLFACVFIILDLYLEHNNSRVLIHSIVSGAIPLSSEGSPGTSTHSLRSIGV